jgi:ATP-dependent protease ClpP protease subunit
MKKWYKIRAARKTAEIRIYEEIGAWGVTAKQFADDLEALGEMQSLNVRIHSPGGDVFEAYAMHNILQRHPARVKVHIDGLCASAATLIALAGDETRMVSNGQYMIHEPWTVTVGNAEDMQKRADLLEGITEQIVGMYARKTGLSPDDIRDLMREETWLTAQQALDSGFIDAIDEPLRIAAKAHDLSRFLHPPKQVSAMSETEEQADTSAVETPPVESPLADIHVQEGARPLEPVAIARMCVSAQEPGLTPILLASAQTEAQIIARLEQARAIRSICAAVRLPERASDMIAAGMDEDRAKLALWDAVVARDQATPVDSTRPDPIPAGLPVDQRSEAEWNRSPELRAEFGTLDVYQSFVRAQEAGRIKLYRGKP